MSAGGPEGSGGPVALVTGGGRGIGAAIATRLAHDGYRVAVNDIDEAQAKTVAADLSGAIAVPGDVADQASVTGMVERVAGEYGRLDVLVNNAGIEVRAKLREHSIEDWDRVLAVNTTGPFLLARAAVDLLSLSEHPAVVNICSTAIVGFWGQAAYDASKGALLTLTRSLAVELGPAGIRANAVCPGFILTDMVSDSGLADIGAKVTSALPLSRMGTPEEIAAAVAFLASADASYITGQALFVDGGWVRS